MRTGSCVSKLPNEWSLSFVIANSVNPILHGLFCYYFGHFLNRIICIQYKLKRNNAKYKYILISLIPFNPCMKCKYNIRE